MVTGVVLSGGSGTRMGGIDTPKQYLMVGGKPIIMYCLEQFEHHYGVDQIVIVASEDWYSFLEDWNCKCGISKWIGTAPAGRSRQHSVYSGLQYINEKGANDDDIVIIHDAARPCVSDKIIDSCIRGAQVADGAMPVITVKDTVYISRDGCNIYSLLNRDELYAGQAPESFRFGKYYKIHESLSDNEIGYVRGSSEIAYQKGMKIRLVPGEEENYKITTMQDLEKFRMQIEIEGMS